MSGIVLVAILAIVAQLMFGPARAPYDMDDCLRAYQRAHSYGETLAVDARPYPGPRYDSTRRCGAMRGGPSAPTMVGAQLPAPTTAPHGLLGIWWSSDQLQSAAFQVGDSTINYPDVLAEFKYTVRGDTLIVHRDDGAAPSLIVRVTPDTLILRANGREDVYTRAEPAAIATTQQRTLTPADFVVAGIPDALELISPDTERVRRIAGAPTKVRRHEFMPGDTITTWEYVGFYVAFGTAIRVGITLTAPTVRTARGLGVGDSAERVRQLYGAPNTLIGGDWVYEDRRERLHVISVTMHNGKVERIFVGSLWD